MPATHETQEGAIGPLALRGCEVFAIHISHYLIFSVIPCTFSDGVGTSTIYMSPPCPLLVLTNSTFTACRQYGS